jgi:hypothetical protein
MASSRFRTVPALSLLLAVLLGLPFAAAARGRARPSGYAPRSAEWERTRIEEVPRRMNVLDPNEDETLRHQRRDCR